MSFTFNFLGIQVLIDFGNSHHLQFRLQEKVNSLSKQLIQEKRSRAEWEEASSPHTPSRSGIKTNELTKYASLC